MIRKVLIVIFFIISIYSFAQTTTINIVSEFKIQFEDTIKFDFKNNYFRPSVIDTLRGLRIGYCEDFYRGVGNRVKVNKQLKDLRLDIIGGKAYYYGAKNEFLLVPDSSIMILKHKNTRIIHNINSSALAIELYADNILLTRNNSDKIILWKDKTFRIKVVPVNQSKCTIIPYQSSKEISNGKMEFIQLIRRDGFVKEATFRGNKLDLKDWLTLAQQKRCDYVIFLYFDFQGIPLRFSIPFDSY